MNESLRHISTAERRRRIGVRHALATPVSSVLAAAEAVVALHSSDPVAPYLSAWSRVSRFTTEDMDRSLYDRIELIRLHGMRRTLWVSPFSLAPAIAAGAAAPVAVRERKRTIDLFAGHLGHDPGRQLDELLVRIRELVMGSPGITTKEVSAALPSIRAARSDLPGALIPLTPRLLLILAMEGAIQRHRPLGTWVSSQYRWIPATIPQQEDPAWARAEIIRQWLAAFGPGTLTDLTWWTGWGKRVVSETLASIGALEVRLDTGTGFVLEGDEEDSGATGPWVALLPGLDPTVMGWKDRSWYLGEGGGELFDRNGNAGPTVWVDGAVAGGWAQRPDGEVVFEFTAPVSDRSAERVQGEARRLQGWLGADRITPRFPSPMSKRLGRGPS